MCAKRASTAFDARSSRDIVCSFAQHVLATVGPIADLDRDPLLALHKQQLLRAGEAELRWAGYLSTVRASNVGLDGALLFTQVLSLSLCFGNARELSSPLLLSQRCVCLSLSSPVCVCSQTSVYGDHDGDWVSERSETRCAAGSHGQIRLAAEREWLELEGATDGRVKPHIFRLAGIYGPGRSALDTVAKASAKRDASARSAEAATSVVETQMNEAVAPPRYVSRVHVDDICAALLASMQQQPPTGDDDASGGLPRVYNLADDEPATRSEVMAYAASLLGASRGDAAEADGARGDGQRARRRAVEHKRVGNARMIGELMPNGLRYPSYREGLRQIIKEGAESWADRV